MMTHDHIFISKKYAARNSCYKSFYYSNQSYLNMCTSQQWITRMSCSKLVRFEECKVMYQN